MEWLLLAAGLALILGTGFFVAVEFSLVALDQATVQRSIDAGEAGAESLLRCLKTLSTQLSSCQLGITLTTLLTGYVMEPSVGRLLEGPLAALGVPAAPAVSLTVAMVLATLLSMLIGELVPKNLAIARALAIGRAVAPAQLVFTAVFKPAILLLNGFSNRVLHAMGIEAKEEISGARSPAELASLVRRSAELGTLDEGTARFVARTLSFSERTAADVMTPRMRVTTLEATEPVEAVVDAARRTGHSRFPSSGTRRTTSAASCTSRRPSRSRPSGAARSRRAPSWPTSCACPRRSTSTRSSRSCARATSSSPSSWTSTAGRPAS